MRRPSNRWPQAATGAALLLASILITLQIPTRGSLAIPLVGVLAAGILLAGLAAYSRRERTAWWLATMLAMALLLAAVAAPLPQGRLDDATWTRQQTERAHENLNQSVLQLKTQLEALTALSAALADSLLPDTHLVAAPFELCRQWADQWWAVHGQGPLDSLAVTLWQGDQRLGWAGPVVPGPDPATSATSRLYHDDHWWVLREAVVLSETGPVIFEGQLRLAELPDRELSMRPTAIAINRTVVRDARPVGRRSWGDAQRGLRLVEDVILGPANEHGVQPRLRLDIQVPARSLQDDRRLARLTVLRTALLGLSVLAWGGAVAAGAGFWLAAWVVRGLWARADLVRMLVAALPAGYLPASPQQPTSLLDPAYFATTFGGGWFASGADALLTALLLAGTATWLWRRLHPLPGTISAARWRWGLALAVLLAGGAMASLGPLWLEVAANANARLIGLQVPLEAWTFWALHATVLMISLSLGLLLVLVTVRGLGALPSGLTGAARPFWLAVGLLLVVGFNYTVFSQAYGRSERDWLERKAEQIVQPQDDWIAFLLEDVLGEMAIVDTGGEDPAAVGGVRGALRREAPAYRLWQRSAVRDLGLPCLVEILDTEGATVSLFATGFLRDFGYEILERGPWWSLAEAGGLSSGDRGVLLQQEERLYPTGRERILRGEIPRPGGQGWLRLELPVQSRRITTLLSQLAGTQMVPGTGYRPRLEIDRPLLLLRGDEHSWLDSGFGDLPDQAAEQTIAGLKAGDRDWAVIELDGRQWLCRWAPLPGADGAPAGEGFLLGLQRPGLVEVLLDLGRLILLNVLLLAVWFVLTTAAQRHWRWQPPGFQGRFLLGYLAIGVILLVVAGSLADRQTFQRIDREARERTRDGLITALGQLRGLLAEQARALAGSDYLAELLSGRLAGERPLGPYTTRQGMVFGPEGELLLDETLSDLDPDEAMLLLEAVRQGPLVVMQQPEGLYLGVAIPLDLSEALDVPLATGTFVYRQQIDHRLLPELAEVVGGELTLRLDGEVVEASHPGRVLSGDNPLLAAPALMQWFSRHLGQPGLQARASGLAFTGGMALPALSLTPTGGLEQRALPAVLAVDFPDRDRDYMGQRRQMALFLAGLITLLLLTAFGLAMVLTWNIFEPLRVLLGATQRLAAGDYSAPLPASTDEVGRLASGFQTMRDRLHAAQARLEARERFLQAVLDQVPVGVLVWDASGRLAVFNPAAARILTRFYPYLPAGGEPASWSANLRQDVTEHLPPGGGELSSSDSRRTLRVGLAPMELGAEAPHQLLVCEDLTEFLAAKKLALNAELARQVAHEIKNPLTPIQLSAQLLAQAYEDQHPRLDSIVTDAVQRILEQVELLRSIAGEFSLLGRPGELDCSPLDLPALVDDLVSGYHVSRPGGPLESRVDAEHEGGPRVVIAAEAVPPVLAHRESLQKVLGNLMQNSLDAVGSPAGLIVEVAWQVTPGTVTLVWADNGPGIAPDVATRLFDPYFSTKSKGTGLGLAICRNLLDMMGGSITLANSDQGTGAVAMVTLPRADAPQAAQALPAGRVGDSPEGKR